VLERLTQLPGLAAVQGNTERYVLEGMLPPSIREQARTDHMQLPLYLQIARGFAWTLGAVAAAGWLDWLTALPFEQRLVLPDGTRLLGVHASPSSDEAGFYPGQSVVEQRALLAGCSADLVCDGHTHWPLELHVDGMHLVNLGCVSNPQPPDLRACYSILSGDESGYRLEHRRVDYDREAVIEAVHWVRQPSAEYVERAMRGQIETPWNQDR
jgi:predicted phosphodiesterase